MINQHKLPKGALARVARRTVLVTLVSAAASAGVAQAIMLTLSQGLDLAGLVASLVLPVVLGSPIMFYQLLRGEQLRFANQKLQVMASTDWLTGCLNRRAFTGEVNAHLGTAAPREGAFLVIDADHFKVINDRYGHDRGDEVLQMIVAAIRANVRDGDLVGRIGGEEFGVFLNGAGLDTAAIIAERIREAISDLSLGAEDDRHPVSVSIGGAVFDEAISFADLFRIADRRLYGAKQHGRNRVELAAASCDADFGSDPKAVAA